VVVVEARDLPGAAVIVLGALGPPVRGRAIAATAGRLKTMIVAMAPTARHFARLMLDTLARLI
jgi:hypothetical protein